jgi:hypothetical protein
VGEAVGQCGTVIPPEAVVPSAEFPEPLPSSSAARGSISGNTAGNEHSGAAASCRWLGGRPLGGCCMERFRRGQGTVATVRGWCGWACG